MRLITATSWLHYICYKVDQYCFYSTLISLLSIIYRDVVNEFNEILESNRAVNRTPRQCLATPYQKFNFGINARFRFVFIFYAVSFQTTTWKSQTLYLTLLLFWISRLAVDGNCFMHSATFLKFRPHLAIFSSSLTALFTPSLSTSWQGPQRAVWPDPQLA